MNWPIMRVGRNVSTILTHAKPQLLTWASCTIKYEYVAMDYQVAEGLPTTSCGGTTTNRYPHISGLLQPMPLRLGTQQNAQQPILRTCYRTLLQYRVPFTQNLSQASVIWCVLSQQAAMDHNSMPKVRGDSFVLVLTCMHVCIVRRERLPQHAIHTGRFGAMGEGLRVLNWTRGNKTERCRSNNRLCRHCPCSRHSLLPML